MPPDFKRRVTSAGCSPRYEPLNNPWAFTEINLAQGSGSDVSGDAKQNSSNTTSVILSLEPNLLFTSSVESAWIHLESFCVSFHLMGTFWSMGPKISGHVTRPLDMPCAAQAGQLLWEFSSSPGSSRGLLMLAVKKTNR